MIPFVKISELNKILHCKIPDFKIQTEILH